MIKSYLTDKINIIRTQVDEWGAITESTQFNVDSRIEDTNEVIKDIDGKEVVGQMVIILEPDVVVEYSDFIQIVSRNGYAVDIVTRKFPVKKIEYAHGFSRSHIEVTI